MSSAASGGEGPDDEPPPSDPSKERNKKQPIYHPPSKPPDLGPGAGIGPSDAANAAIENAIQQFSNHFTERQLDCIGGIETGATWNTAAHSNGSSRYGMFQWNKANWDAWMKVVPAVQRVEWSTANANDVGKSAMLTIFSLEARFAAYSKSMDSDSAVLQAISGFGEGDAYGRAVLNCEQAWAHSFNDAVAVINSYNRWVAGGRKGPAPY
jgi:hypothetical protein